MEESFAKVNTIWNKYKDASIHILQNSNDKDKCLEFIESNANEMLNANNEFLIDYKAYLNQSSQKNILELTERVVLF